MNLHVGSGSDTHDRLLPLPFRHLFASPIAHLVDLHRFLPVLDAILTRIEVIPHLCVRNRAETHAETVHVGIRQDVQSNDIDHSPIRIDGQEKLVDVAEDHELRGVAISPIAAIHHHLLFVEGTMVWQCEINEIDDSVSGVRSQHFFPVREISINVKHKMLHAMEEMVVDKRHHLR